MSMGTASTMACLTEALGVQLPGGAAWPAADSRRLRLAQLTGRRIVEMVSDGVTCRPSSPEVVRERHRRAGAIGGSTNAVIHLLALAGSAGRQTGAS